MCSDDFAHHLRPFISHQIANIMPVDIPQRMAVTRCVLADQSQGSPSLSFKHVKDSVQDSGLHKPTMYGTV